MGLLNFSSVLGGVPPRVRKIVLHQYSYYQYSLFFCFFTVLYL